MPDIKSKQCWETTDGEIFKESRVAIEHQRFLFMWKELVEFPHDIPNNDRDLSKFIVSNGYKILKVLERVIGLDDIEPEVSDDK